MARDKASPPSKLLDVARIRQLRESHRLTQAAAAARAGLTGKRWQDIESGRFPRPRIDTVVAVARALGLGSVADLVTMPPALPALPAVEDVQLELPGADVAVHVEASPAGGTEPAGGNSGKSRKGKAGGDGEELVSVDRAMGRRGRRAGRTVKTRKGEVGPRRRKDGEGRIVRVLGRKTAGSRKAKRLARAARIAS